MEKKLKTRIILAVLFLGGIAFVPVILVFSIQSQMNAEFSNRGTADTHAENTKGCTVRVTQALLRQAQHVRIVDGLIARRPCGEVPARIWVYLDDHRDELRQAAEDRRELDSETDCDLSKIVPTALGVGSLTTQLQLKFSTRCPKQLGTLEKQIMMLLGQIPMPAQASRNHLPDN